MAIGIAGYFLTRDVVWWAAYLAGINIATFIIFGFDKAASSGALMRVPERVIYIAALCGATPAVLIGQKVFRHKTVKTSFQLIFWIIVVAQVAIIAFMSNSSHETSGGF